MTRDSTGAYSIGRGLARVAVEVRGAGRAGPPPDGRAPVGRALGLQKAVLLAHSVQQRLERLRGGGGSRGVGEQRRGFARDLLALLLRALDARFERGRLSVQRAGGARGARDQRVVLLGAPGHRVDAPVVADMHLLVSDLLLADALQFLLSVSIIK